MFSCTPSTKSRFSEIKRNPFRQADETQASPVNIEGIIYDASAPMALINGEVMRVGEQVGDMKITEIQKDGVTFQQDKKQIKVPLVTGLQKNST